MFLSVRQKSMRHKVSICEVIDLNTGKAIPRVVWANDKTGRYRQYLLDEDGKFIVEGDHAKSKIFTRNKIGLFPTSESVKCLI